MIPYKRIAIPNPRLQTPQPRRSLSECGRPPHFDSGSRVSAHLPCQSSMESNHCRESAACASSRAAAVVAPPSSGWSSSQGCRLHMVRGPGQSSCLHSRQPCHTRAAHLDAHNIGGLCRSGHWRSSGAGEGAAARRRRPAYALAGRGVQQSSACFSQPQCFAIRPLLAGQVAWSRQPIWIPSPWKGNCVRHSWCSRAARRRTGGRRSA